MAVPWISRRSESARRAAAACAFLPGGHTVVYLLGPVGQQAFWLLDVATQHTRQLARLPGDATTNSFDITPDGKRIVFDRLRELSDIVMIDVPD